MQDMRKGRGLMAQTPREKPEPVSPAGELREAIQKLRAPNATRLGFGFSRADATADLLEWFAEKYSTDIDIPECPNCGEGCPGHAPVEYCLGCGYETPCRCIGKAISLARAINGNG